MEKDFPKMELDLAHVVERETFSLREKFPVPAPGGGTMQCDSAVTAEVSRTGSRYLLRASVTSILEAECSRCLETFEHRLETSFDLVFQRGENISVPEGVDEDDFILVSQEEEYCYDIFPRVREAVLLELPIRYLCAEDCAGICPRCGGNLNNGDCGCRREEGDPRWGPLKNLLKDKDDD